MSSISPNHQKMALNSRFVSLTLFSLAVAAALFSNAFAALDGRRGLIEGGWSPISDPKAPEVVEIAKFALDAHNKEANESNLKFESVIKGEIQVVAGFNYKVVIAAKDGSAGRKYEAVVWDKPWEKFRQLTSFKQL